MNDLLTLSAIAFLSVGMANHKAIEYWLLHHKALGVVVYAAMAWLLVAGFVWVLYALVEML